jgi:hypothetical protein
MINWLAEAKHRAARKRRPPFADDPKAGCGGSRPFALASPHISSHRPPATRSGRRAAAYPAQRYRAVCS